MTFISYDAVLAIHAYEHGMVLHNQRCIYLRLLLLAPSYLEFQSAFAFSWSYSSDQFVRCFLSLALSSCVFSSSSNHGGCTIFRGELSTGGKQHAPQSPYKSNVHCTLYLLIIVHVYKHSGGSTIFFGGGGNCLSLHWPLQQSRPYLKGVLSYGVGGGGGGEY